MRLIGWMLLIIVGFTALSVVLGWFGDGAQTVHNEYKPSALLKKYEYFKDLSAALDKKRADLKVYQQQLKELKEGADKGDDDDKFYYQQTKQEAMGILLMYNQLASEYNSQMAKFNWRFCNKGDLPDSNLDPLPREYAPYLLKL